jgi:hypothetical protein
MSLGLGARAHVRARGHAVVGCEWQLLEGMMRRMDMMDAKIDSVAETFQVAPRPLGVSHGNSTYAARSCSTGWSTR